MVSTPPGTFDVAYSMYSSETDVLSLSSMSTPQRPVSTHTFGSEGKGPAHGAMHRQFSNSSYHSLPRSPLGYRPDGSRLSPNNIVVLEEEIDPLDKTPQEETITRFEKEGVPRNGPASSTNSPDAATDDLFPEGSQTSSHTSVQEEETLRQKLTLVPPDPSSGIRRATTGIVELGPVIEDRVHRSTSLSAASSPRVGQRILRKQVPEWTESLENLEQLRITPTTTPQTNRSRFSSSNLLVANATPAASDLEIVSPAPPREDGILARTARRLRLGSKEKERERLGSSSETPTDISSPIIVEQTEPRERRRTMPHIPARTVSLATPDAGGPTIAESDSRAQHPYNHFIYAQDYAEPNPDPLPLQEPPPQPAHELTDEARRPSDQTFTSGFSLTRLTDEDNTPTDRDTPGKRLAPLPEPLSGYEGGDRFSTQPLAGMSKSFSENHLVLGGPARTTIALDRGVSFQQRRPVRTTKLFTLSETKLASVPAHQRTASRTRVTPRGSPMLDHDAPTFPSAPSPIPRSHSRRHGLFSRTKSSLHVDAPTGNTSSDTEPTSDAPTRPFSLAARRARVRAREREAAIFAAGPDRLPTTRELLEVGRHRVYDVAGRKVAFRDIIAAGGGWQTVVVFIRHW